MNISETIIYIDINDEEQVTHIVGKCKAKDLKKQRQDLKSICQETGVDYYE